MSLREAGAIDMFEEQPPAGAWPSTGASRSVLMYARGLRIEASSLLLSRRRVHVVVLKTTQLVQTTLNVEWWGGGGMGERGRHTRR